jgi:uncharacterized protein YkwD
VSCLSHVLSTRALTTQLRRAVAVTTLAVALAGLAVVPTGRPAAAFQILPGIRVNAVEARLLRLVNAARTNRGIPALKITPGYTDVARRWSAVMATRRQMAHNPSLVTQVAASGGSAWRAVAENVGYGYDADTLFQAYMRSTLHRANILNPTYRYVGMGWAERPGGLGFNTQVFVNTYSTRYGRSRVPAYGGVDDAKTITESMPFASFERHDSRATAVRAKGTYVRWWIDPNGTGDGAARVRVRQGSAYADGGGGLGLRTSTRFNRVRRMSLTIRANTPTGRSVRVHLLARVLFGGTTEPVGAVTLRDGQSTTVNFVMPADARVWRNDVVVHVSKSALTAISPGSLSKRYVDLSIYRIGMTV